MNADIEIKSILNPCITYTVVQDIP